MAPVLYLSSIFSPSSSVSEFYPSVISGIGSGTGVGASEVAYYTTVI